MTLFIRKKNIRNRGYYRGYRPVEICQESRSSQYYRENFAPFVTEQPNAIITAKLIEKSSAYNMFQRIRLVYYLSEMTPYHKEKTPIDILAMKMENRFLNENGHLKCFSLEKYIRKVFNGNSSTPERFMQNILGEEFETIKNKINNRPKEYKREVRRMIVDYLTAPISNESEESLEFID